MCLPYFILDICFFCLFQYMLNMYRLSALCLSSYFRRQICVTLSTSSLTQLESNMKRLVDSKQYHQALDLFHRQSTRHTDISVNMAIRACIGLQDHQRGYDLIRTVSSDALNNYYTQASLIRFYSKSDVSLNSDGRFNLSQKPIQVVFCDYPFEFSHMSISVVWC